MGMETGNKKIPANVKIGENSSIGEFVALGEIPFSPEGGKAELIVGANCRLRSGTVIYAGTTIGNNFQTGHNAMVREGCRIGNNVSVGTNAVVERDSVIKDNVRIHSGAFIPEYTTLEEGAWIGPNAVLTNAPHPASPTAKQYMKGPHIGKNAKIGANATILPYLSIGENSLVGAGSVVVDDVGRNAVAVGNPAKEIKNIYELKLPGGAGSPYRAAGESMNAKKIHRTLPSIDGAERRAVLEVLASGRYVKGGRLKKLEEEFASFCGTKYAIGVNSGTSALFLALKALFVEGKEVITVSNSFMATANAIELAGAKAVFVEPDSKTYTIDVRKIEEKITPKTAAIIPVHLYGQCADMDAINRIAKAHGLFVLEDACQAHGAQYKGKKTGGLGDAACFSFYPTKNIMCAGDGGIITTNDEALARKIRMLRDAGREGNPDDCAIFGFNNRLSDIQAAVASEQLKKLDAWNSRRREIAKIYEKELGGIVQVPHAAEYATHIYHLYTIQTKQRDALKEFLGKRSIETSVSYSIPLPLCSAFSKKYGYKKEDFPVSTALCQNILSLPMFPQLCNEEVLEVCSAIKEFFK